MLAGQAFTPDRLQQKTVYPSQQRLEGSQFGQLMIELATAGCSTKRSGATANADPAMAIRTSRLRREILFSRTEVAARTTRSPTSTLRRGSHHRPAVRKEQLRNVCSRQVGQVRDQ